MLLGYLNARSFVEHFQITARVGAGKFRFGHRCVGYKLVGC